MGPWLVGVVRRHWCKLLLAAFAVAAVAAVLHAKERNEDAEAADARADSAVVRAERSEARSDSLARAARRATDRADSIAAREAAARDSIRELLADADREIRVAGAGRTAWSARLDTTLAELAARVRPALVPVVRRAAAEKDSLDGNVDRLVAGLERRAALLVADTISMAAEIAGKDAAIDSLGTALTAADRTIAAKNRAIERLTDARDRWRRAADPPIWEVALGRGVVAAAVKVGGGVIACATSWEACAGYVGATGADVASRELTD